MIIEFYWAIKMTPLENFCEQLFKEVPNNLSIDLSISINILKNMDSQNPTIDEMEALRSFQESVMIWKFYGVYSDDHSFFMRYMKKEYPMIICTIENIIQKVQ